MRDIDTRYKYLDTHFAKQFKEITSKKIDDLHLEKNKLELEIHKQKPTVISFKKEVIEK